jgi:hypothetical protein
MQILYFHDKNNKKFKVVTVAGIYVPESGVVHIGVSRCSKKDNWNRKLGNKIAFGRALKNPEFYFVVEQNSNKKKVVNEFIENAKRFL